ncbi:hypothetical protein SUVZ_01G0820 [Saccharomyces uvarum]|uniref:Hyphally-regulated cell wall protein N-terminal domain-containing protein n=1 Tax=Saccharomyces uvarum TaxID=230603 RepID=A0ABN8WMR6_SACUV|nr:hypothetical protein SUVZ_10G0020 [Saccharomyces uvarum]CAI4055830.1 hypothetical protein SUVZ_01G0820 [Saccharomyces uvarum]
MFNRLNKFQAAVALALYSQSALGQSFGNSSSTITSASTASASATASLSSSDGTVYLPSTTISGDLTVTGKVIATEAVEVAAGGKLTLLDGEKYSFTSDLKVDGDLIVAKSEATYEGTAFDVSGATFEVSGNFHAEESAATSASVYSFTPGSFDNTGDISLSLSKTKKGEVTFSPYSNAGAFSFSNAILNGGSVSGLQRRDDDEGSKNNGEINLDNGSTYVIVEPVSGNGTVNIISGNLYLHYPDTFTGQTVNFKGEGVIAVDPTDTNTTPIPVVGYTGKNQIAITQDVSVSYNSETGVLTATKGNVEFSFAIGTGFSSSGFSVSEGLFAEAYAYYLNYDGVIASTGATSSVSATSIPSSASASGSVTSASVSTSGKSNSTSVSGSATSSAASGSATSASVSTSGKFNSTSVSGSVTSSAVSGSVTSSAASGSVTYSGLTLETASVYTETLTYANATSTVVVSCSKTTDSNGNIYTITKTVPCSTTIATITSCDDNGCHVVPAPTATGVTATTVSSKSYTTVTVTHCDDNGCNVKTVTSEAPKATSATTATTIAPKSYTTVTVTHCDDNGCSVKTVTSEAPKATTVVSKSGSPTSSTTTSQTHTGIIVQSEGIAAGLRTNALSALVGAFLLAFF